MAHKFQLALVAVRKVQGAATGVLIGVSCQDADTGATSERSWFAATSDFPAWPPSRDQVKQYIVAYLQDSDEGKAVTRAQAMKQATATTVDDPQVWPEADKELTGL